MVYAFRKESLPDNRLFFESALGRLTKPNGKSWALGRCPFHRSKSGRSFSVNIRTGGWRCFGCGAHGDIVKFVMLRDGLSFKEAAQSLGAWDSGAVPPPKQQQVLERYLAFDYAIDGVQYRAAVRDEPRNYADKIRRFYVEASDRLMELSHGDCEAYPAEQEVCWERMVLAMNELREIENYE
jgi:hypothetical protein